MKMIRIAVLTVAIFMAAVSIVWGEWTGLAGDQKISYFPGTTSDYLSRYPIICAYNGNGATDVYAAWVQGKTLVPYEVFFSKSNDNGRTWTGSMADFQISANDGEGVQVSMERLVDMAVNSLGEIYVVWAESLTNVGYEVMLVKSTDGGDTWLHSDADFAISYPGDSRALDPAIAIDHDDGIHVVWHQSYEGFAEIFYGYSNDGGATWTSQAADRIISFPDGIAGYSADIAVDPDNNVHVVWREQTISGDVESGAVHYGRKLAGETQFSSETADNPISMNHRSVSVPDIIAGSDGSVHVAYEVSTHDGSIYQGVILYTGSTDGGDNWSGLSGEQVVCEGLGDGISTRDPVITVTSTGAIAITYAWYADPIAKVRVSNSTDGGTTWTGNTTGADFVGDDDRPEYNPTICTSIGDTLHVAWNEDCQDEGGSSGYYEIKYSRGDTLATSGQTTYDYLPGDANMSNGIWPPVLIGSDVTYLVGYFRGLNPGCKIGNPLFYCSGDANGDCQIIGSDVTKLVSYFRGIAAIEYCPDYVPLWPTPDDLPTEGPSGWPNCQ
jgi:hypothetical protein